jgi:hypothetical protein
MSQILHQFPKLRIYYEPEDGEDRRPTKKGITIDVGLYPELKKAMLKIEQELLKQNLVEEEALEAIVNE